jgi:transposase
VDAEARHPSLERNRNRGVERKAEGLDGDRADGFVVNVRRGTAKKTGPREPGGPVLDVMRDLLGDHAATAAVLEVVGQLVSRNQELEMQLAKHRASKHSNERVAKDQLDLFLNLLRASSEGALSDANKALEEKAKENGGREETTPPPKQPPLRRKPPAGLRREDNPIAVPATDVACPVCGKERGCVAHEMTEVIDFKQAEVFVRRDIREILGCDDCDAELVRAPMGDKVVAGGAYGSGLVAKLVVGKYWDGMPLYRQGEELERLGLSMPSSSMSDQIMWAADLLRPIWRLLLADVLSATVMHVDGTSLPVLDRDSPKGIVTGALWGYVGDTTCAAYIYTSTAKKDGQRPGEVGPAGMLALRSGPVVADASNLFDSSFERADLIEVGCNMHARRYFTKALDANDVRAAIPIAAFRTLYDVEDAVRDADTDRRREERQQRSKPVYEELVRWCRTYEPTEPPSSMLGRAVQYALNHRVALTRFLDDGRLPIDNGIVERLHRRPAVGRRNYLFAGSHDAGERAAIAYSVLATCHLLDVNPMEYLSEVLPRLARDSLTQEERRALVPAVWKLARGASAPTPTRPVAPNDAAVEPPHRT